MQLNLRLRRQTTPSALRAAGFRAAPSLLLAALLAGAAGPCGAAVLEDTVATVNGRPILLGEYRKELDAVLVRWKQNVPGFASDQEGAAELRRKVLDQMVDNELLGQEAEKRKLKVHDRELEGGILEVKERNFRRDESGKVLTDAEMDDALAKELKKEGLAQSQFRERIRKQMLIRKVIDEAVRPKVKPPEEPEIRASFERVRSVVKGDTQTLSGLGEEERQATLAFVSRVRDLSSERVRVAHLLIKLPADAGVVEKNAALKKAQEFAKRAETEDFGELARKHSEDQESASRGGDIGFILKGWMPPEFERTAFSIPVGDVSRPVETQFGYHLIRVQEKKASETVTYDKLKDDLSQFLHNLVFQGELEKLVKALRAQAHIDVRLPEDGGKDGGAKPRD